jgi:hypothetical protein
MLSLKILIVSKFMKHIVCIDQLFESFHLLAFIIPELATLCSLYL